MEIKMNYYEMKIKVKLTKDIKIDETSYKIGVFINNSMLNNPLLKKLHEEKFYKYVFDSFYPIEKDKIYIKGKNYFFRVRSINLQLLNKMAMSIYNHEYSDIKAIDVDLNMVEVENVKELYTLKPIIITEDNGGPWIDKKSSIDSLIKKLNGNLEKKLNQMEGSEKYRDTGCFIENIEITNRVPIKYKYKSVTLLGNKVKIKVKEDENSQMKAFIAIALGLGEKGSSLGAGFCGYKQVNYKNLSYNK